MFPFLNGHWSPTDLDGVQPHLIDARRPTERTTLLVQRHPLRSHVKMIGQWVAVGVRGMHVVAVKLPRPRGPTGTETMLGD